MYLCIIILNDTILPSHATTVGYFYMFILWVHALINDWTCPQVCSGVRHTWHMSTTLMLWLNTHASATNRVPAPSLFPSRTAVVSACWSLTPSLGGCKLFNTTILMNQITVKLLKALTLMLYWDNTRIKRCSHNNNSSNSHSSVTQRSPLTAFTYKKNASGLRSDKLSNGFYSSKIRCHASRL